MADINEKVQIVDNLAAFDTDKFDEFGYVNAAVLRLGSGETVHLIIGGSTPVGVTTYDLAPIGSIFFNTGGGSTTSLYVKIAASSTGWVALSHPASG